MRPLHATELLDIWEQGQARPPVWRALLLLAAASPDASLDDLACLSIGERDSRLLALREWAFGPQLVSEVACPGCDEQLELAFHVADIRAEAEPDKHLALAEDGYEVEARLPNSHDLVALANQNGGGAQHVLLERCLLAVRQGGADVAVSHLPPGVVDKLIQRMAEADPQADVRLALTCPDCGHQWRAAFDIVAYFWSEITTWARRVLREVHILASAYGWREADILALSARRRHLYLEMIGR
jgi:uncharacterized protein (UPF0212 family)